jgi:phosphatidylinositol alpha-1,6-mannosyltransferase
MRLLLATSQFAPELGGVPRLLSQLCANLPGDIELCVLSVQQQPPSFYADYDAASPHPIERVPAQGRPGWTSLRFASRLGSIIRTWQPDVILCGVAYPTAILTYATTRLWRVPYVVYTHSEDVTISRQGKRWALGRALRGANGLIAVSQFTRQEMQAFGVPPDRVGVIHPGIGVEQFALASRPPELAHLSNRFLLLTVARWVRRKGIDTVLQSMTRVLQQVPNAHYVLVGSGPDEGYFRDLARELGLNEHVTFAGRISDQSLPAF